MSLFSREATEHSICTTRQTGSTPGHFELYLRGANFIPQMWLSVFHHLLKTNSKTVPLEMPQQIPQPSFTFHSTKSYNHSLTEQSDWHTFLNLNISMNQPNEFKDHVKG